MARADYRADSTLLKRVFDLLELAFGPRIAVRARAGRRWGLRWDRCSTPFVHEIDGRIVGHVGVMAIPAVLDGTRTKLGGIHAVSVHPEHRGRGIMRALMEQALAWCDERFATCALAGDVPIYERFGFRHTPEHRFVGPAPRVAPSSEPPRVCSADNPEDVARWRRLLAGREPVSQRAALLEDLDVFCFDAADLPVHYAAELDGLLVYTVEQGTLRLYDVVACSMPALARVVAAVAEPVRRVEVYFAPDRLAVDLEPEPYDLGPPEDPDTWMVRGPWTAEPFMWARTARW